VRVERNVLRAADLDAQARTEVVPDGSHSEFYRVVLRLKFSRAEEAEFIRNKDSDLEVVAGSHCTRRGGAKVEAQRLVGREEMLSRVRFYCLALLPQQTFQPALYVESARVHGAAPLCAILQLLDIGQCLPV